MDINNIKGRFDEIAEGYDRQRRSIIPCFDDYYGTISFLANVNKDFHSILDLGAGTGLLTEYLHREFPDAEFTLVDVSEQMLDVARRRFRGMKDFEYIISDYSETLPQGSFDLIASALSIHHLEEKARGQLYSAIYNKLDDNGCFINLDQFNAESDIMNNHYIKWWHEYIKLSGIENVEDPSWLKRRELDRENTIADTLNLLKNAGFRIAECIYSYMKFGVVLAIK